jgi:hypothetical protein
MSMTQFGSTCQKLTVRIILIIGSKTEPPVRVVFEARLFTKCADDVNERGENIQTSQNLPKTKFIDDQAAPRTLLRDQTLSMG